MPIHPEFLSLLQDHLAEYDTSPSGDLFTLPRSEIVTDLAYPAVFHTARVEALIQPRPNP